MCNVIRWETSWMTHHTTHSITMLGCFQNSRPPHERSNQLSPKYVISQFFVFPLIVIIPVVMMMLCTSNYGFRDGILRENILKTGCLRKHLKLSTSSVSDYVNSTIIMPYAPLFASIHK